MTAEFEFVKKYYFNLHNNFLEELVLGPQFVHSK